MKTSSSALSSSRIKITVEIQDDERQKSRNQALMSLQQYVEVKGFRKGKAPLSMVESQIKEDVIIEEIVRALMPSIMTEVKNATTVKPIIKPSVTIENISPLTVSVMVVGMPEVTLKKPESIVIEKKECTVTKEDIDDIVTKMLESDALEEEVEEAIHDHHSVVISSSAKDEHGEEMKTLTLGHLALRMEKDELFQELTPELKGMKKGEEKTVTISFAKDHDFPELQGKKVTIHMKVMSVKKRTIPTLTDEYLLTRVKQKKTVEEFKKDIHDFLLAQKKDTEMKRREDALYETVRNAVTVDLAPELIEEEMRGLVMDLKERLEKHNATIEQWLKERGKSALEMQKEMEDIAKNRLLLRYGMQALAKAKKITVEKELMEQELERIKAYAKKEGSKLSAEDFKEDSAMYASVHDDLAVQKLIQDMIAEKAST